MKLYSYYSLIGYKGITSVPDGSEEKRVFKSYHNLLNPVVDEKLILSELKIEKADNTAGTLSFSMPATNPSCPDVDLNMFLELCGFDEAPTTSDEAIRGGAVVWVGRVITVTVDMYGNVNCVAEGAAAILRDIYLVNGLTIHNNGPAMKVKDYIKYLVEHSESLSPCYEWRNSNIAHMPDCLKISEVGFEGYANSDNFDVLINSWYDKLIPTDPSIDGFTMVLNNPTTQDYSIIYTGEPISLFDWIQQNVPDGFDDATQAYYTFRVQVSNYDPYKAKDTETQPKTWKLYLGLDIPTWRDQTVYLGYGSHIIYGENLISADLEYDLANLATSIAVYGGEQQKPDGTTERLSIIQHDPAYLTPYLNADQDYIERYGIVPRVFVFDDITDPNMLYVRANDMRNMYTNPIKSMDIEAINLVGDSEEWSSLDVGSYIDIDFPGLSVRPTGINAFYRCTKSEINVLNPIENRYHVEYSRSSLTSEISSGSVGGGYSTTIPGMGGIGGISGSGGGSYNLPIASADVLGGIKVGSNLTIDDTGVLKMLYVDAGRKAGTTAGAQSTAEGQNTTSSAANSHAEGVNTVASGGAAHAEGNRTSASMAAAHAEGANTSAESGAAHAEGMNTVASGAAAHAEGNRTRAKGKYSHAEGSLSLASGEGAHAEGGAMCQAIGNYSHAEGFSTASGEGAHAEGDNCYAYGRCSHVEGYNNIAYGDYSHVIGQNSVDDDKKTLVFIIGNSDGSTIGGKPSRSNAFSVSWTGNVQAAGQFNSAGADYAEMFEWEDNNPDNEDRVGRMVTLNGEYISLAESDSASDDIIGVISGAPSVSGDTSEDQWSKMYLTDIYGRKIMETVTVPAETDREGKIIIPEREETRMKLNPEYDNSKTYISRSKRPEWDYVGLLGKLVVLDDGTANVNDYIRPLSRGIATKSDEKTRFRVMKRLDDSHVRVIIL